MKHLLKSLSKSVLAPLDQQQQHPQQIQLFIRKRLTQVAFWASTWLICNEKMNDIMKIVKSHEECGNKLPKIKDGGYVINLDEYKSTGTQ